jgi:hypothetical protein
MAKKAGPLDYIKHLTEKKTPWESLSEQDQKAFSPYMINLWLSMNPDLVDFVNDLQKYTMGETSRITPKQVYKLYLDFLPKMKLPFSKFVKATKKQKYNPELLKLVADHFYVNTKVAEEYVDIIPKDRMKEIVCLYGKTDKEVKALLK